MGLGVDADDEVEGLPPPAPPDDPEVVELGHIVLHHLGVVPQLPTKVLIVADSQVHHRPVSLNAITLKAEGRVLFDLQWLGSAVQRTFGEPTRSKL